MPLRVITFLLVLVLFWSGFGPSEPTGSAAATDQQRSHAQVGAATNMVSDTLAHTPTPLRHLPGEVEHTPLHELLSQAQADPLNEGAGLLPAPLATQPAALLLSAPHRFEATAFCGPWLAGLLRPPCAAGLRA